MNEKMDNNETRSIAQWEKANRLAPGFDAIGLEIVGRGIP